jgi:HSP20 family protein
MSNLVPREHFMHDLFDFRRDFEQMFNRFLSWPSTQEEQSLNFGFAPPVESFIDKDGKKFHCQILLPGVDPKDVDIQVLGNTLMISGERTNYRETNNRDFLQREIAYGSFQRSIALPQGVDVDKLSADYRNGMLEITAPVSAAALPKKIEIKAPPAASKHATA